MDVPAKRSTRHRAGVLAGALLLAGLTAGCTAVVRAPAHVTDGVHVFVLLDDQHRGLVLPDGAGGLVEYGFGEWWWYALGEDAWYDAFRAVLWPTRSTLGRRATHANDLPGLRRRFYWMTVHRLAVERSKATALRNRLAALHAAGRAEEVFNRRYGFHFVPHPDGYWALHNCNDKVVAWLAELGCAVSRVPICMGIEFDPGPE